MRPVGCLIMIRLNRKMTESIHAACRRTIPERIAVRPAAVSAGGGIYAGVRHHGLRQSGARLALHAGRLLRGALRDAYREFRDRLSAPARRHAAARTLLSICVHG